MLVLSRKAGEKINIGSDITVEVRRISGNRVTLALHAPREVRILRGELTEAANAFAGEEEAPAESLQEGQAFPTPAAVPQENAPIELLTVHSTH